MCPVLSCVDVFRVKGVQKLPVVSHSFFHNIYLTVLLLISPGLDHEISGIVGFTGFGVMCILIESYLLIDIIQS